MTSLEQDLLRLAHMNYGQPVRQSRGVNFWVGALIVLVVLNLAVALMVTIGAGDPVAFLVLGPLCFLLPLYFLPALIAYYRWHHQTMAIAILNLFAGWTVIAWIIAVVWACTSDTSMRR